MYTRANRSRSAAGIILILLGLLFLAFQLRPDLADLIQLDYAWPLIVVGVGGIFLLAGLITGTPGLAVPASIISGIGAILYWQNATGQWETWAYAWTLIPGFVGLGIFLARILGDETVKSASEGLRMMMVSAIMFFLFGSLFGDLPLLRPLLPFLLIAGGGYLLIRAFIRR